MKNWSREKVMGDKQEVFLNTYRYMTDGYAAAERKVRLDTLFFVHDLKIKRV
jgi:hypothetical protein